MKIKKHTKKSMNSQRTCSKATVFRNVRFLNLIHALFVFNRNVVDDQDARIFLKFQPFFVKAFSKLIHERKQSFRSFIFFLEQRRVLFLKVSGGFLPGCTKIKSATLINFKALRI